MLETQNGTIDHRARVARALAKEGFEDVYVIDRESARDVLTDRRSELLQALRDEDVESIRDLAERIDRDKGDVSRDLSVLAKHDLVEFEMDGTRKIPSVKHKTVIVEPLL